MKRALVLNGGGSRGAYQIGAWQALDALGVRFDGVYGTSIGALNAALFAQGDLAGAVELWSNITVRQIMAVEDDDDFAIDRMISHKRDVIPFLRENARHLRMDISPLEALARANLDEGKIRARGLRLGVMATRAPQLTGAPMLLEQMKPGSLADWVIAFNRLHPDINFKFYTGYNSEIHGKLEKDGREFAFCNMKIMNSDYAVRHCGIANLVVITPNDARFRALGSQPFPLALFGEVPMITRSSTSTLQQEFMRWMKQSIPDTKLNVAAAIDDTETIKRLVAAGVGVSVISEVAARQYVEEGRVLSFPLEGTMPYHLYFVYKKKFLSPEQTLFRDFILEQVAHVDRPAED